MQQQDEHLLGSVEIEKGQTSNQDDSQATGTGIGTAIAAPVGEKILCPHCLRTASNGIKCKGICVADSDY